MSPNLEISSVATGLERSVFIPIPKKDNAKEYSNCCTVVLISCASKVMLKLLQARLQHYVNQELPDVQLGLEKAEEPEPKLPTSLRLLKEQRNSRKTSPSASLTILNPLTVWITTNWGKFFEMGIRDHLTCLLRNLYAGKKKQLELDMKRQTGSKLGKEYVKAVYCHPAYLTYMQSTS